MSRQSYRARLQVWCLGLAALTALTLPQCLWAGRSSLVTFDYGGNPNIVYVDVNQHIFQQYFDSTTGWHSVDITANWGGALASRNTSLITFEYGDNPNIAYVDVNQHITHLYFYPTTGWHSVDITANWGGASVLTGTSLAKFNYEGDRPNIVYVDVNQHITHLYFYPATGWHSVDITANWGGASASRSTSLITFDYGGNPNIAYVDVNQHITQLYFYSDTGWHSVDITANWGGALASQSASLARFNYDGERPNIVYVDVNQHITQLYFYSDTGWHSVDITVNSSGALASPSTSLVTFDYGGNPNIAYVDVNQHISQLYFYPATGWHSVDITANWGGALASPGTSLARFNYEGDRPNIVYVDANQHISQLYFYSDTGWHNVDITANWGGALPSFATSWNASKEYIYCADKIIAIENSR